MARSILRLTTIALLVLPAAVHGQSAITGKWQGKTPNGFPLELDVVATEILEHPNSTVEQNRY